MQRWTGIGGNRTIHHPWHNEKIQFRDFLEDQLKSHFAADTGAAPGARRIHEWLKSQMADGSLAVGARLPSTRALALDLGVSRTTITAAYEQLAAEGYLETAQGARARVAAGAEQRSRAPRIAAAAQDCRSRLSSYGRRVDALAQAQPARAGG